jgi:hypothetical protein
MNLAKALAASIAAILLSAAPAHAQGSYNPNLPWSYDQQRGWNEAKMYENWGVINPNMTPAEREAFIRRLAKDAGYGKDPGYQPYTNSNPGYQSYQYYYPGYQYYYPGYQYYYPGYQSYQYYYPGYQN